jgi:signal transduction histidine kinase
VIMQRLHEDDPVGHVLAQEPWEVLSFPAIAEADEAHGIETIWGPRCFSRRQGEALHPGRETRSEVVKNGVLVKTQLAQGLPLIQGDRVQLQQVILNLIINAVEAMSAAGEGSRELLISTGKAESDGVLVAVRDSGPGLAPASFQRLFEAFYTTKPGGLRMGLSICRSIIEAHRGRLWATANVPQGAVFQFTVSAHPGSAP